MRKYTSFSKTSTIVAVVLAASLGAAAKAAVIATVGTPVATTGITDFAASSTNGGSLALSTVNASKGAGGTIAGGVSQGVVAGGSFGETFYGISGNLAAITEVWNYSPANIAYRPFLFDLGVGSMSAYGSVFNPSAQTNLLDGTTLSAFPGFAAQSFLEFDFSGGSITLDPTHSYAFGLYDTSGAASGFIDRANGVTTDPNGVSYVITGGDPSAQTNAYSSQWGGGVRNMFVGVYTTAVATPEPASLGIVGLGAVALLLRKRSA
ncbi:MAG TPA: PEP-CTERM sorting domain-containing protein [Phycisphaerae bacterium]|nr:PEP-CTERM sorting domain-containing protein [Phycisphaerae bacterium]